MFYRFVPLTVGMLLLTGCGKKADRPDGDPAAPDATYALTVREEQKGDKTDVTIAVTGLTEIRSGDAVVKLPEETRIEYTETILDIEAGSSKPTHFTRAYKKATKYDPAKKGPKALPHQGKTITVQKKGAGYEYTADGKKLTHAESKHLDGEFGHPDQKEAKLQELLPKSPVKVGETWLVEPAAVRGLLSGIPFAFDDAKSKTTGRFTRAYTQDGKLWGTITFEFDLVLAPTGGKGPKGGDATGTVKITGTLDAVIDGSAPDGTMGMIVRAEVTGTEPGKKMMITADISRVKTVKSVN